MTISPVELAGALATAVSLASLVPQVVRLRRTADVAGLSVAWAALGFVTETGWVVYTAHQQLWVALPSALVAAAMNLVLIRLLLRAGAVHRPALIAAAAWAAMLVAVPTLGSWAFLGVVLGSAYGVQVAPLLWSAYRTRVPSGISVTTWIANLVEFVLWWAYGELTEDTGIVVLAVVGTVASLGMIARLCWTRVRLPVPTVVRVRTAASSPT